MPSRSPQIRTTVRNFLAIAVLRLRFVLGVRLAPGTTLRRATQLFCTPARGARERACTLPLHDARVRELDVDGRAITTYTWGDPDAQPYVLFAHGWSSGGARIAAWVRPLREAGFAVVAFDQLAHGRSPGTQTTLVEFVRNVLAVGAAHGPAAAVVGHSMGGAAAALALARGLQAQRAVLVAPPADIRPAIARFGSAIGFGHGWSERLRLHMERRFGVVFERLMAPLAVVDLARPALVVHDVADREVPWADGEVYARLWPGARLLSTQGLGHRRVLDDAGVIAAALAFLRGEPVGARVVSSPNLPFGIA